MRYLPGLVDLSDLSDLFDLSDFQKLKNSKIIENQQIRKRPSSIAGIHIVGFLVTNLVIKGQKSALEMVIRPS